MTNSNSGVKEANQNAITLVGCMDGLHEAKCTIRAALILLGEYIDLMPVLPENKDRERADCEEYSMYYLLDSAIKKITASTNSIQKVIASGI